MSISVGFNIDLFLLVFLRVTGLIIFNPVFGRTNVPNMLKAGLALLTAFVITPTLRGVDTHVDGVVSFIIAGLMELAFGLAIGVLVNLIFGVVIVAGEYIDMQLGLAMAQMYDPGSGVNMPIVGNLYNFMLLMVFFGSNAHLSLLSLLAASFQLMPPGSAQISASAAKFVADMGGSMLEMGLRMAVPVIAVELICVVAIGLIMRAAPQINIFSFGIQIQAIVGIIVMLIGVPVTVSMMSSLVSYLLEKTAELIRLMPG